MQKGGIVIQRDLSPDEAFKDFIENCDTCLFLNLGSSGFIFQLTLKHEANSPYLLSRSNGPTEIVRTLLVKCVIMSGHTGLEFFNIHRTSGELYKQISLLSDDDFNKEVSAQCDVYKRSLDEFLEPICPAIVYAGIRDYDSLKFLFERVDYTRITEYNREMLNYVSERIGSEGELSLTNYKIGVIAMEIITGADTLQNVISAHSDLKQKFECYAIFELCRLYNLGYIHGDPHNGNFIIKLPYIYFGDSGRCYIIDFGRIVQISPRFVDTSNLMRIAREQIIGHEFDFKLEIHQSLQPSYQWLLVVDNAEYNRALKILVDERTLIQEQFKQHIGTAQYEQTLMSASEFIYVEPMDMAGGRHSEPIEGPTVGVEGPTVDQQFKHKDQATINIPRESKIKDPELIPVITKTIETKEPNIFDKLDPTHIFTPEFIKNYIEEERAYADEMVKLTVKVGGNKRKRRYNINNKTKKTNKIKKSNKIKKLKKTNKIKKLKKSNKIKNSKKSRKHNKLNKIKKSKKSI